MLRLDHGNDLTHILALSSFWHEAILACIIGVEQDGHIA